MDRPRHRRRDPQRTGPIRNSGKVLRDEEPWRNIDRQGGDDAASRGVREGYRLIEEQIHRGRRMAQELDDEPRTGERYYRERRRRSRYDEEPWPRYGGGGRGGFHLFEMPIRHIERLTREILRQIGSGRPAPWRLAELVFRLQIEMISELARLGFSVLGGGPPCWDDPFDRDADRVTRDIDESLDEIEEMEEEELEAEPWDWPAAPSTPTTIRSTVPIPVYVSSHERTEIDLDLPAGSQSLDLEVEPPMVSGTDQPAPPAFEAELVVIADWPAILRIEVPRGQPAGRYRRRILLRATGEPVGALTVQVGTVPAATAPKARKKR